MRSPIGRPLKPGNLAFSDWQDIRPHPTRPCKGGCEIKVDAQDGYCRECREALQNGLAEPDEQDD